MTLGELLELPRTAKVYGTLDGVNLIKDLYGLNSLISITYDVHWHYINEYNEKIYSFTGLDIIHINADLNDVALDYGGDTLIALTLVVAPIEKVTTNILVKAGLGTIFGFSLEKFKNWVITNYS